ncbi:MAG TPA: DUF4136 domain-containing protein [Vicinamibacterales bacterium]|nr:DUF4136 domain-containing protein [Vicinamibacterales bacterium]
MHRSTRIDSLIAATALALALNGCATVRPHSYLGRGIDFGDYRTYAWGPVGALSTGDPRLDNNQIFIGLVEAAVDRQLAAKGFEKTKRPAAQLLIHLHARLDQRLESNSIDREYRRRDGAEYRPFVYEAGTLLLDLIDTRTNGLAWRGWAEGSLDGVIDNQDSMEASIDDAVAKILARLPVED